MVRVLLCGAAGWTGRAILKELLSDSSYTTIIAFDVRPESWDAWADVDGPAPDASSRVALRYGDMADFDTVEALVQDSDVIIHTSVFFPNPQATGEFSTGDGEQQHAATTHTPCIYISPLPTTKPLAITIARAVTYCSVTTVAASASLLLLYVSAAAAYNWTCAYAESFGAWWPSYRSLSQSNKMKRAGL